MKSLVPWELLKDKLLRHLKHGPLVSTSPGRYSFFPLKPAVQSSDSPDYIQQGHVVLLHVMLGFFLFAWYWQEVTLHEWANVAKAAVMVWAITWAGVKRVKKLSKGKKKKHKPLFLEKCRTTSRDLSNFAWGRGNLPKSISGFSGFIISKYLPMACRVFLNIQLTFCFCQLISECVCYNFCTLVS